MKPNRTQNPSTNYWVHKIAQITGLISLLCLISLSNSMTVPVSAFDPHLRLPWAPGLPYRILGSQYGKGLHTGADYYAIDFGLPQNSEVRAAQGGYATRATLKDCHLIMEIMSLSPTAMGPRLCTLI